MGIPTPVVPAICIPAIGSRHWSSLPRLQIQQPVIRFLMPDRETAIITHRKHDVPAIIRRTWMGSTLAQFTGIEDGIHLVAKLTGSGIKTNLADIILDILVTAWDRLCGRRAEIERLSIGREYRISLIMVFRHRERIQYQFMGCRLINKDIRCLVENFDSLILHGMETLMGGIGTVGAILARWMPVRINHRTLQGNHSSPSATPAFRSEKPR